MHITAIDTGQSRCVTRSGTLANCRKQGWSRVRRSVILAMTATGVRMGRGAAEYAVSPCRSDPPHGLGDAVVAAT